MDQFGEVMSITVRPLTESEFELYFADLARLRIDVFQEFSYSYDGWVEHEVKYLRPYLNSKRASLIAAFCVVDRPANHPLRFSDYRRIKK